MRSTGPRTCRSVVFWPHAFAERLLPPRAALPLSRASGSVRLGSAASSTQRASRVRQILSRCSRRREHAVSSTCTRLCGWKRCGSREEISRGVDLETNFSSPKKAWDFSLHCERVCFEASAGQLLGQDSDGFLPAVRLRKCAPGSQPPGVSIYSLIV